MDRTHKKGTKIRIVWICLRSITIYQHWKSSVFSKAVQCMTCLNTRHSTMECSLRTHCMICHSKAHSVEQCEYNLLNKTAASVRQIYPENSYQENMNNSTNRSQEDDRYDRRDRNDNWSNDNDHGRDEYWCNERYHSWRDEDLQNDYLQDNEISNKGQPTPQSKQLPIHEQEEPWRFWRIAKSHYLWQDY